MAWEAHASGNKPNICNNISPSIFKIIVSSVFESTEQAICPATAKMVDTFCMLVQALYCGEPGTCSVEKPGQKLRGLGIM